MSIPVIGWIDDIIKDAFQAVFSDLNRSSDEFVRARDFLRKGRSAYRQYVADRHGRIQILGMSAPMPLRQVFVKVRANRRVRSKTYLDSRKLREGDKSYLRQLRKERAKSSVDPEEALRDFRRLALLGAPGAGKTTLLKFLALLHTGNLPGRSPAVDGLFPFLVALREHQPSEFELQSALAENLSRSGFPNAELFVEGILGRGRALVMIDGLDEVDASYRDGVHREIVGLTDKYPSSRFLVACRTAAYEPVLDGFTEVEIEGFVPSQRYAFVEAWFAKSPAKQESLVALLKARPKLQELASTPLLLSLLCILYGRELQLPKNRVELYEKCLRTMLVEWDTSRGFRRISHYEQLSDRRKEKLLNFVAANSFLLGLTVMTDRDAIAIVRRYLPKLGIPNEEADGVLKEIESHHGILLRASADTYSFSHLSLQEYLTASYCVDTRKEGLLVELAADVRWLEVVGVAAGLLEDATEFITKLINDTPGDEFYRLCLAAHCVTGELGVEPDVAKRILARLIDILDESGPLVTRAYPPRAAKTPQQFFVGFRSIKGLDSNEASRRIRSIARFLSALNCAASFLNGEVLDQLAGRVRDRKVQRALDWVLVCKEAGGDMQLYSNVLLPDGLGLPMEQMTFERRLGSHAVPQLQTLFRRTSSGRDARRRRGATWLQARQSFPEFFVPRGRLPP